MTAAAAARGRLARLVTESAGIRWVTRRNPASDAVAKSARPARRILAVLECRPSDDAVLDQAIHAAATSGGFLTLMVVVPRLPTMINAGPFCIPRPSADALRSQAEAVLHRATTRVPSEIPVLTVVEERRTNEAIRRRVQVAAHDLVVARRRSVATLRFRRRLVVPLVPVPS